MKPTSSKATMMDAHIVGALYAVLHLAGRMWYCAACDVQGTTANCAALNLTEVPQEGIPNTVLKLSLSNNGLQTLKNQSFITLSNLTSLAVKGSQLSTIEPDAFLGLTQLQFLDLARNELDHWPDFSSACSSVRELHMFENKLWMATNQITCLTALEVLTLSGNRLTAFPNLTAVGQTLKRLHLYWNQIPSVSESDLLALKVIEYMDLISNQIVSCEAFPVLPATTVVDLYWNQISSAEKCLPHLGTTTINFSMNKVMHIPQLVMCPSSITFVNFQGNRIRTIAEDAFDNCTGLVTLLLAGNLLTEFPYLTGAKNSLKEIVLDSNLITNIPAARLDELTQLKTLHLWQNKLSSFPNVPGPSLEYLALSNNQFTTFPKLDIVGASIKTLSLNGNIGIQAFSNEDISGLVSLKSLLLARTSITAIPALPSMPASLVAFHLEESPVTKISPELMMAVASGLTLAVTDTDIRKLPSTCGPLPGSSVQLELTGTPLQVCSCDMLWLKMLDSSAITIGSTTTCSGLDWYQATLEQLYEVCEQAPVPDSIKVTNARRVATGSACSLPHPGIVHDAVTRAYCLVMCMEQPGCLGFNFRSTGSSGEGQCSLVAALPGATQEPLPDDPEGGQWNYYAVDI